MGMWKRVALLSGAAAAVSLVPRQDVPKVYPDYSLLESCPGYSASNVEVTDNSITADLTLAGDPCDAYGTDLEELTLQVTYETDDRIHVKIQDKGSRAYQVPESVFPRPDSTSPSSSSNLAFDLVEEPFSFRISRKDTDEVLFDTSGTALVFESQYLRLRTSLPDDPYLYGLGEHSDPFRLKTTNYARTLWNQDSYGIPANSNLYGSQPFYMEHRESGSHGVFFLNSNGMDILIDNDDGESGTQHLEYNTIGGVLDFYFLAGPTPQSVTQQYADVAGLPAFPPYWGLGFHQCRYGYQDAFAVAEAVYNYSEAGIPLETMWTDIDYMDRRLIFTTDPERFPREKLRTLVSFLHERDQHYIVMVDPAAGWQDNYDTVARGIEDNIWLLRENGSAWLGVVWPGVSVFPDWFAENITSYWNNEFAIFFDEDEGIDIDALWIDMNEPSSFPCFFPCDDPYGSAVGFPPEPPRVRENPRPLPGFPCEFQPADEGGCDTAAASSKRSSVEIREPIPMDAKFDSLIATRQSEDEDGEWQGLPDRDLLYPQYSIRNKAAYRVDWNDEEGGISNKTVLTDVISQNGLAMYDTHNLYGALMSTHSYDAMLARRPGRRPLIITRATFSGTGHKVGHWLGDNLSSWPQYRASIRTMLSFTALFQFPMTGSDVCGFGGSATEELCARWASLGAFNTFFRNHNSFDSPPQEFYRWPSVTESAIRAIDIRYRLLDYMYTAMAHASRDGSPVLVPTLFLYPDDKATWALDNQFFYGDGLLVAPILEQGATSVAAYLPDDIFYDWYTHEPVCGEAGSHTFSGYNTTTIPLLIRSGVILPLRQSSANTTTALRTRDFEILIPLDADGTAKGRLYFDDGDSLEPAENGGASWITLEYADGELVIDGEFGYDVPVVIAKVTLLDGREACSSGADQDQLEDGGDGAGVARSRKVEVSLNKAGSVKVDA
jgi:alpha-glucosidase